MYTDSSRNLARNGAQLITVPTLETMAPGFHWEVGIQGVLRAVENRVATVKADVAYSAMIVDPYGRILARRDGAPEGEAFAKAKELTGHTPLAIFVNGSMQFTLNGRTVKFYSFPQGQGTGMVPDGGWTIQDLQQVLDEAASKSS